MLAVAGQVAFRAADGERNDVDPTQLTSGRLELARWIASPANPLTARVMVNRIWQHHFGRGIVATSDNFGTRGGRPSHPELLDWLASRFIEQGWSVKSMHRLMLLSSTYQQGRTLDRCRRASRSRPDVGFPSFPRRRLSAEELRDAILAASGTARRRARARAKAVNISSARPRTSKRSIRPNRVLSDDPFYTTFAKRERLFLPIVRNMLPDVLALFDAADPNGINAQRNETTVATQSLFLLNSSPLRDQAWALAEQLLSDNSLSDACAGVEPRIGWALGRVPSADEQTEAGEFLAAYASCSCPFKTVLRRTADSPPGKAIARRCSAPTSFCMWSDEAMATPLSRRQWLQRSACGFGSVALAGLLADEARPAARSRVTPWPRGSPTIRPRRSASRLS